MRRRVKITGNENCSFKMSNKNLKQFRKNLESGSFSVEILNFLKSMIRRDSCSNSRLLPNSVMALLSGLDSPPPKDVSMVFSTTVLTALLSLTYTLFTHVISTH